MTNTLRHRTTALGPALAALAGLAGLGIAPVPALCTPAPAPAPSFAEQAHGRALDAFRRGQFPEAYGRFVSLADAGHPASARFALWMCEHGLALFGKDWDCGPDQVEEWARAAGVAAPRIEGRTYRSPAAQAAATSPRAAAATSPASTATTTVRPAKAATAVHDRRERRRDAGRGQSR